MRGKNRNGGSMKETKKARGEKTPRLINEVSPQSITRYRAVDEIASSFFLFGGLA